MTSYAKGQYYKQAQLKYNLVGDNDTFKTNYKLTPEMAALVIFSKPTRVFLSKPQIEYTRS